MRNLTIKRHKTSVACLNKARVYIEDPISGELNINGVQCTKIGELKNGQECVFPIYESAARVFVISDKLSKDFCNDCYKLPAGNEDIYLSGKNVFNLVTGHPFRFDGVTDEETLNNRKKASKKGIIVTIIALIIGIIFGFIKNFDFDSLTDPVPEAYTIEEMQITLTDKFDETEIDGYNAVFYDNNVSLFILKEEFELFEDLLDFYSIKEYGQLVLETNGFDSDTELEYYDGLTYFVYESEYDNEAYTYFTFLYESGDAFWIAEFAILSEIAEEYRPTFFEWAKSVSFTE